jgi:hypothetical protein
MVTKRKARITTPSLIAPCGMNCSICRAYGRQRNPCAGCRGDDSMKTKTRLTCTIKRCEQLIEGRADHCCHCGDFPCKTLVHLDSRYTTRYGMSMIENLANIRDFGIHEFVERENQRWACRQCGEMLCVHKPECPSCGHLWNQSQRRAVSPNQAEVPEEEPPQSDKPLNEGQR